jgi:hypothetical protein
MILDFASRTDLSLQCGQQALKVRDLSPQDQNSLGLGAQAAERLFR